MNYKEFLTEVEKEMNRLVGPTRKVDIKQVVKNNNTVLDALVVFDPLINISPNIYLNPYYHRLLDGVSMEDILSDIYAAYKYYTPNRNIDTRILTDYENCHDKIIMKLINYEHNKEMLLDVPYLRWMDFAIIFQCLFPGVQDTWGTITISKSLQDLMHVDTDTLYQDALKNTPSLLPVYFSDLDDCLREILVSEPYPFSELPELPTPKTMFILSNHTKYNGAGTILYPHMMEKIADALDCSYFIIPSSVNELLIIPCPDGEEFKRDLFFLTLMVQEVNETEVTDMEFLSDQAYYYNREDRKIISNTEVNGRCCRSL